MFLKRFPISFVDMSMCKKEESRGVLTWHYLHKFVRYGYNYFLFFVCMPGVSKMSYLRTFVEKRKAKVNLFKLSLTKHCNHHAIATPNVLQAKFVKLSSY